MWRARVGVYFLEQVRALARCEVDIDARIFLQPLDDRCDGRIVHRSSAVDEDLPPFTIAISLPTLVEPTQPLDIVTRLHTRESAIASICGNTSSFARSEER